MISRTKKKYLRMKKLTVGVFMLACMLAGIGAVHAQIVVPDLSPFATVTQRVGFTDVRIEYSRPSARGRIVFGDLVPYGEIWRLGANASTKISIGEDITINDNYKLSPGTYSLFAIPGKNEWTMIVSRRGLWGAYNYLEADDVFRFQVTPETMKEKVETFTIQFANVCKNCAELQFMWDFTKVSLRLTTFSDEVVMGQIKEFTNNPEAKLAGEYYLSAKYYLDTSRDLKQALVWVDKALTYAPGAYWMMHTKAEIQAKMGDYKAAIETATLSKEQAKAKNDEDYVRINDQEIEKWKELRKTSKTGS